MANLEAIDEAKKVIASHERFARKADLAGVLSNIAEDIVLLTADSPLVEGKQAFSSFYSALFQMGQLDFQHDYSGAEVVADTVFLHGVARGTLTPAEGVATTFANNFLFVLKNVDGRFKVWRGAFAPSGG